MKIILSKEIKQKCLDFSYNSVDTSAEFYALRNQFNKDHIRDQIYTGKLGEYVAWSYLKEKYPEINEPDCNIYEKKDKTFDVDLKLNNKKIHIKSQDSNQAIKFGMSWIFQYKEGATRHTDNEVFGNIDNDAIAVFVLVNKLYMFGEIKSIIKICDLHKYNLFKAPVKEELKKTKLAVYAEDLEKLDKNILWQA